MSFFEKHLNKQLEDPEFKKAWEESEQEYLNDKFTIHVIRELISEFGLSERQALDCIEESVFTELLEEVPDFVFHYDSTYWANVIFKEKLEDEKILQRIKQLEDDPDSTVKWEDIKREK